MHWLRRLVFRSAWLDQRVKEGELDVAFDREHQLQFSYVQPDRGDEPVELAPEPSWGARRVRPAARPPSAPRPALARAPRRGACAIASAPARRRRAARARSVPLAARSSAGRRPVAGQRRRRADHASSRRRPARAAVAMTVSEPPSAMLRAAASARRAARGCSGQRVDQDDGVAAARGDALGGLDRALDRLAPARRATRPSSATAAGSTPAAFHSASSSGRTPASTTCTLEAVVPRPARRPGGAAPRSCRRAGRR